MRLHTANREISIETHWGPKTYAAGSERYLVQALTNIMLNAVAAMPMGGKLSVRKEPGGKFAVIRVSDTGMGMSEEVLSRLFEPFFTTKESGHGLGLTITRWIVEKHSGELRIQSEGPGKGSSVEIRLPLS